MLVVQMHGEPGSGKSTLARAIAPRIDAIVLDKDIVKAALLRSGIGEAQAGPAAYEAYFAIAASLIEQGRSVILDNPVFWEPVEAWWRELAAVSGSPPLLIDCVLRDRDELRRRLATRDALESQPRQPLDASAYYRVTGERLTLDTSRPLDALVDEAVAYITAARVPA